MTLNIKILFLLAILASKTNLYAQVFTYDFSTSYDGWDGDFADYPISDSVFYELEFQRATLPNPLNTSNYALKISGNNHSDDLFMFIKRKISGLLPNTTYNLQIEVELASNAPTNAFGVGGAPGESVTLKAGASAIEPLKVGNSNGYYRMNIDKSNQTNPGVDMDTIGHVGVADTTTVFAIINRSNSTHPFSITTDSNGEVWVCIGSDSGFEATTTLYYNAITLSFSAVTNIDKLPNATNFSVFPNPATNWVNIQNNTIRTVDTPYFITDLYGNTILRGLLNDNTTSINISPLASGVYFLTAGNQHQQIIKLIKQ